MLEVRQLNAWYDESHILHGMQLDVREGEIVTLLGRNGAGKTTTLRAIMGILRKRSGSVKFLGKEAIKLESDSIARAGIGYCPEERGIFTSLTVGENLMLPPIVGTGGMDMAAIDKLFPNIRERWASPGGKLSGGEQQMLAIARILRTGARLLLLDEPTEGLAPAIVSQIGVTLQEIKRHGLTILMVEQDFRFASRIADRHYVVEHGKVVDEISNTELANSGSGRIERYLAV